jgi:hypothetical protein
LHNEACGPLRIGCEKDIVWGTVQNLCEQLASRPGHGSDLVRSGIFELHLETLHGQGKVRSHGDTYLICVRGQAGQSANQNQRPIQIGSHVNPALAYGEPLTEGKATDSRDPPPHCRWCGEGA